MVKQAMDCPMASPKIKHFSALLYDILEHQLDINGKAGTSGQGRIRDVRVDLDIA